jgi:signal transduction histidine kinase
VLLVDVVRQAAIAVRSSLLARELQESREQLVLGREEDRRRIRRDLHDGLGPVLGGVAMRLDAAGNAVATDPETAHRLVVQSRAEITEALADVRRLVQGLRPPALDDLGVLAAVEQQADRVRSSGLEVTVHVDDLAGLPAAVEVAAYRIVSEALTNVARHADARSCSVALMTRPTDLEVVVRDDGRGIAEDVVAGVGLRSLRERVEELGGGYEVVCPPGGGTTVRAWLPVGGNG